jgi:prepilin-type N-terminal cleavage/methylation domain-containing protein
MRHGNRQQGFTLVELVVASALGLLVLLAVTSLFKTGVNTSFIITQRLETQQNLRAAIELMTKDIGLAGAGLPSGGLQLSTAGTLSKIGCYWSNNTCYVPGGTYPASGGGTPNYMYGIIPGFSTGVENSATIPDAPGQVNSRITTIYCDYNFPLSNFSFNITSATQATATIVQSPKIFEAADPNNLLASGGLNTEGDLLLFTVSAANPAPANGNVNGNSYIQTAAVVADTTSVTGTLGTTACAPATGCTWTLNFASDVLNFNQSGGANNLSAVSAAVANAAAQVPPQPTQVNVCRLYAVTYFLEVPAAGGTVQTPRLMRQVNAQQPIPVADNIINLQFTYDVINSVTGTVNANVQDPIGSGDSPALIQKVNIWVMGSSLVPGKSQNLYLSTSVSAGNMSFCNSFSSSTTACQ